MKRSKTFEIIDMMHLYILLGIFLFYFIPENILVKQWLFVRSRQCFLHPDANFLAIFLFVGFFFIRCNSNRPVSIRIILKNSSMLINFHENEFLSKCLLWIYLKCSEMISHTTNFSLLCVLSFSQRKTTE